MNKKLIILLALLLSIVGYAQDLSLYRKYWHVSGKDTLPYRLLLPENYDAKKKYPMILFLHGAGERGNDNEKQLIHGGNLFLTKEVRKQFPAIIVFPQCPVNSFWSNVQIQSDDGKRTFDFRHGMEATVAMKMAEELLYKLIKQYPVNTKQLYVGGLSMGGMGTFEIVGRNSGLFAAAFPICGGGNPDRASNLIWTSWWVFHGAKDDVVLPIYSEIMVEALKKENASVKYTLYPEANHNSWDPAFAEPGLLTWLFSQKKK